MSSPAPVWLDDIVREFGRSAGLSDFSLNDRGAAAATFETGAQLRRTPAPARPSGSAPESSPGPAARSSPRASPSAKPPCPP